MKVVIFNVACVYCLSGLILWVVTDDPILFLVALWVGWFLWGTHKDVERDAYDQKGRYIGGIGNRWEVRSKVLAAVVSIVTIAVTSCILYFVMKYWPGWFMMPGIGLMV